MRRTIITIVLLSAAAAAVAGCAQTEGLVSAVQDAKFSAPTNFFKVPEWGKLNEAGENAELGPKGPVAADELISASGQCPPAPAAAPAAAPEAAKDKTAASQAEAAAPPPDRLEPAGLAPAMPQGPVVGGVALGMTECGVARSLGTPSNVSISAGPKGQRRVVLTYLQGDRPGLYSFQSGRLIQVDATPQQANKYDKQVKKPSRRARSRRNVDRMYVQ